jgi:hypothetical protein
MRKSELQSLNDTILGWNWFRSVGTGRIPGVLRVSGWDSACEAMANIESENAQLGRSGRLSTFLDTNFRYDYQKWNQYVDKAKPFVAELTLLVTDPYKAQTKSFHKLFHDTVKWDLNYFFVATCFLPVKPFEDYDELFSLYERGFFPCGWKGAYPDGKMIVF